MAGIISDLQQIYDWIVYLKDIHDTVEGNKGRCRLLITRCGGFENCLRSFDKKHLDDSNVSAGVHSLSSTIGKCVEFVDKYGKKGWKRFVLNSSFAKSIEGEFKELNALLSQSANDLHFSLSVHSYEIDCASTVDNEATITVLSELLESTAKITADQSNILSRLDDQSMIMAKMAEVEHMMPELLQHSAALLELVHQHQQENHTASGNSGSGKSSVDVSPAVSEKSVFDDLKFASIDSSCLSWDKNDLLGKGTFATVYKCTFEGRACALKHFENIGMLNTKEIRSIKREARIMQVAKHMNIIDFIGFDVNSGIIVCELAKASLSDVLHEETCLLDCTLCFDVKLEWLVDIAQALRYLHFHGIIHRDIKPQNILLTQHALGDRVVAKVADFGISTAVGMTTMGTAADFVKSTTSAAGSIPYMAPELIDFDESGPIYSPAVDVYAFGVTANETLSEQVPWEGLKVRQIEKAVEKGMRPKQFPAVSDCEKAVSKLIGDAGSGTLSGDAKCRPTAGVLVSSLKEQLSNVYKAAGSEKTVVGPSPPDTLSLLAGQSLNQNMADTRNPVDSTTSEEAQQVSQSAPVVPFQWAKKTSWDVDDVVRLVKFSPDGSVIAVAPGNSTVILIYDRSGRLITTIKEPVKKGWFLPFHKSNQNVSFDGLSFSPDGTMLAASSYFGNCVKLFVVSSGRLLWSTTVSITRQVCFLNSFTLVASEGHESCAIIDVSSGSINSTIGSDGSKGLCVSNRGTLYTAGCHDLSSPNHTFHCSGVSSVCINSDGSRIYVGLKNGSIRVYSDSGQVVGEVKGAHGSGGVISLSMNATNSVFASGGSDSKVKLWNASTLECIQTLNSHKNCVYSVSFSPHNNKLVSGSEDMTVKLWACCYV